MRRIALDTETHCIRPGMVAPRLVCVSLAKRIESIRDYLFSRDDGLPIVADLLRDPDVTLIGVNIYFDLGVLCAEDPSLVPLVFRAFEEGRIRDIPVAVKMRDIRDGRLKFSYDEDGNASKSRYDLASLAKRYLNKDRSDEKKGAPTAAEFLAKYPECRNTHPRDWPEAPWRLRYSMLERYPINKWPESAKKYALDDATDALAIDELLGPPIADELNQIRYQWPLTLMGIWGLRTDPAAVEAIKKELEAEAATMREALIKSGLMRAAGTKDMATIGDRVISAYAALGREVPRTATGKPSTEREVLEESGDPDLMLLAKAGATFKLLSKDVPQLAAASRVPMNPRWNGLVETGRTSVSPNVQNLPRKGGIRECHVPRESRVFCFVDYDTAELRALAQVCLNVLGHSRLAEVLNAGQDPHAALGATLMGIAYDDMVARLAAGDAAAKDYRQFAKIPNFGLPGGMGAKSLVAWAQSQLSDKPEMKARMNLDFANELIRGWHDTFPEMQEYFAWINSLIGPTGEGEIVQLCSERVRGGVTYCAACNSPFQGLVADAAKSALWAVSKAAYVGPGPLYGILRPVLFLHDEIGSEIDYRDPEAAARAAEEKARIMVAEAQKWMPDVVVKAKPVLCKRWYKGAESVYRDGVLVPSKPAKVEGKTKWVEDAEPNVLTSHAA